MCSACVGEVAPEAGAEDTTAEAADGLGEFDPGSIDGGGLNLGGGVPGTSSDPRYALPIMSHRIANVIASRRLAVVGEPAREVIIKLGKPRPEADPSVWRCSYLLEGIPDERRRMAHGAESLQALQCALQGAKATIAESGVVCTWNTEPGDIGIPYTVPT